MAVDKSGVVREINTAGKLLLNLATARRVKPVLFTSFLDATSHEIFIRHVAAAFSDGKTQGCDLKLARKETKHPIWIRMRSVAGFGQSGNLCLCSMTDISGHARKNDIEKCLAAGMNHHASKPVDKRAVINILTQFFPARTAPLQAPRHHNEATPPPVIDYQFLKECVGDNLSFLHTVVEKGKLQYQLCLEHIAKALKDDDPKTAHLYTHKLKGSVGSLGGQRAARAAESMEGALKSGERPMCVKRFKELAQEVSQFLEALSTESERPLKGGG